MKWFCQGGLVVLLWCGGMRAESVSVVTYNVENYGSANRMTAEGFRKDYPKPEIEKAALRRVICTLRADVLVLQEMGGPEYVEELRRDLKNEGLDYPHTAIGLAGDEDRHVAILSRRPLTGVVTHTDLEFAYLGGREKVKRGLLEASIGTDSGDLTLFAIHLKSRFTDRPDDPVSAIRRNGEATAIRDRILRRFPEPARARFLILGDCNDSKNSRPVERLRERGKTTLTHLLPAADTRGETWTHAYRKEDSYSRVDHILVSPGLYPWVKDRAARIFDGDGVKEASDHRPVFVVFELSEEPKKRADR